MDSKQNNSDKSCSTDHETKQKSTQCKEEPETTSHETVESLPTVQEELVSMPPSPSSRKKPMARSFSSFDIPAGHSRIKRGGRASLQLAFSQTVKMFKTARRGSKSNPGTPMHKSPNVQSWNDTSSWAGGSIAEKPESNGSFYKSFEDLIDSTPLSTPASGNELSPQSRSAAYAGDVWCAVGRSGGTVRVPGTDVSLHINARQLPAGCACTNPPTTGSKFRERSGSHSSSRIEKGRTSSRKKRTTSSSSSSSPPNTAFLSCTGPKDFDGRIVLGLEDPPEVETLLQGLDNPLQPQQIAHAGPAIRLGFVDEQLCDHEITIQLSTNLKTTSPKFVDDVNDNKGGTHAFVMTCLQSDTQGHNYREVKTCFQFGDTLQATLDVMKGFVRDSDAYYRVYVVPIIKVVKFPAFTPWSFVTQKIFGVGVYGPKQIQSDSVCCVSISPTSFIPPILDVTHETTQQFKLQRWNSFSMPVQEMQAFDIQVQTPQLSHLSVDAFVLSCKDALTCVRRDFTFQLRITTDGVEQTTPRKENSMLVLTVTGKEDRRKRKLKCDIPVLLDKLRAASPRLKKQNPSNSGDLPFLWNQLQLTDKLGLSWRPAPRLTRSVCPLSLAITQRQRNDRRRQGLLNPYLVCYDQADYLVVISDKTLIMNDKDRKIECLPVYTQHKTGLVQTNHVRKIDFDEFCKWDKSRPTAMSIIEAVTEPVQHFNYSFPRIQKKLVDSDIAWSEVMKFLQFGKSFMMAANEEQIEHADRRDMIAYFLTKYKEHCSAGPQRMSFCQEIIKSLLYADEYELAVGLLVDCCLFTVAIAIANRWPSLATNLTNTNYEAEPSTKLIDKLDPWKGAWTFLSAWKREIADDHAALVKLHSTLDDMLDFPRKALSCVTASIIFISSIDCLRCYDTRL